jgi:hypothetical protein
MRNLTAGIASPILAEAPKRAIKFSLNEKYKEAVKRKDGTLPWTRYVIRFYSIKPVAVLCDIAVFVISSAAWGVHHKSEQRGQKL